MVLLGGATRVLILKASRIGLVRILRRYLSCMVKNRPTSPALDGQVWKMSVWNVRPSERNPKSQAGGFTGCVGFISSGLR